MKRIVPYPIPRHVVINQERRRRFARERARRHDNDDHEPSHAREITADMLRDLHEKIRATIELAIHYATERGATRVSMEDIDLAAIVSGLDP